MDGRGDGNGPPREEAAAGEVPSTGPRQHTVLPTDTLAGIALRYGVSLADVRRANGLLTDSAMFGRRTLAIPPPGGLAPPGPALATLAGMIVTGYGTGGGGGGGGGGERRGRADGGGPLPAAGPCCTADGGASPARPGAAADGGRRVGSEVELTAMAGTAAGAAAGGGARFGGVGAETLRRRRGGGGSGSGSGGWQRQQQQQRPSPPGPMPANASPSLARPTL